MIWHQRYGGALQAFCFFCFFLPSKRVFVNFVVLRGYSWLYMEKLLLAGSDGMLGIEPR